MIPALFVTCYSPAAPTMLYMLVALLVFPQLTSASPNFTEVTKLIEQQFHFSDADESTLTTLKFDIHHEGHKLSFEAPISIKGFSSKKTVTLLYPQVIQGFEDNWHSMQLMFNFGKANFTSEVSYQQMLRAEDLKNPKELPSSQRIVFRYCSSSDAHSITSVPVQAEHTIPLPFKILSSSSTSTYIHFSNKPSLSNTCFSSVS